MSDEEMPDGFEWAWVPAHTLRYDGFELLPVGGDPRPCRFTVGPGHAECREPSVARLKRGKHWWHYCGVHLYGRRIREGVLECHVLREVDKEDDTDGK